MANESRSRFAGLLQNLRDAAERATAYSKRHLKLYAFISFLSPAVSIVDDLVADPHFNTLIVRSLAVPACLPALLYPRLPRWLNKLFPAYFALAAAFVFPFSYGLMLSLNAALAPPGKETDIIWILQYFVALFVFIQVMYNPLLASLLWIVASVAAVAPVFLIEGANHDELKRVLLYPLAAYITAIGLGVLTNRQKDVIDTERLKAASALGASIAHEIRTPLASVRMLSRGVEKLLPLLVDAYLKAQGAGLETKELRPRQLSQLREALRSIQNEVRYSNTMIDMLLLNTADKPIDESEAQRFFASCAIRDASARFPFNNANERRLIILDPARDFQILAPRLLIVHVLFNLIKNALQHVQKKKGAWVEITTVPGRTENKIIVHDNGVGIPAYALPHVFDRFYTTNATGQGAGIGLSFCRMVMESIGGKITCDSVEGEFTTFTLAFKKV